MAIDCGQGLLWSIYGCIFVENTELLRDGGGEKTKIFAASASVDGIGAAGGRPGRRERRRRGAAGLVVVMVLNKSKSFVVPLSMVLFIVHSKLFCTDAEFAPAAGPSG